MGRSNRLVLAIASVFLILEGPTGFVELREPAVLWWLHFLAGFFGLLIAVRPQFLIGRFSEESEVQWDHAYGTTGPRHTGLVWRTYPKLISMVGIVYILRGVFLVIMSASPTTTPPITVDGGLLISVASSVVFGVALSIPAFKYDRASSPEASKHP